MSNPTQCCAALGGQLVDDGFGDLYCEAQGSGFDPAVYSSGGAELSTFHQSLACGYLDEAAAEQNPISFEGLNNFIEGLGGVVDGILGLFNPPTSQAELTTASGAGQLNDAKLGRYLIGLAVLLGLILAGFYLIKRKK
jgi:hypothetical protein